MDWGDAVSKTTKTRGKYQMNQNAAGSFFRHPEKLNRAYNKYSIVQYRPEMRHKKGTSVLAKYDNDI